MEKNKKIVITITSILLVLALIVGVTYALEIFQSTSGDNTIKSGKISMNYTESSNVINITNALPMTDEDGKIQSNYFDFSITSNAQTNVDDNEGIKIPYNLIIEPKAIDADKDALTNDQIKVYLTKVESGVETVVLEPTKISELTAADTNFNLYITENIHKNGSSAITTKYRLRAWIDYEVESASWTTNPKKKQYKFAVNVNATGELNEIPKRLATEVIMEKVGTDGLVADEHPATTQLKATTSYRYTGSEPKNYVKFNDELWNIIGVFEVDDGTGNIKQRIKLTKDAIWQIGIAWANDSVNDWSKASGMTVLNSGDFWNKTNSFDSIGLTASAKAMIDNAKWYLGGTDKSDITNATQFYSYERGTTVYSGRPTSWVGKVAYLYASDFGYATSGGSASGRTQCLAKEMINWNDSSYSYCKNNDWLIHSSYNQWTLTHFSGDSSRVFYMSHDGDISPLSVNISSDIRPAVYLSSDIKITGGIGTYSDPYTLSL